MGLDPELVRQAERAKEHLAVAQHAAYRARVDYHHAIRRLHRGRCVAAGDRRGPAPESPAGPPDHRRGRRADRRRRWRRQPPRLSGPLGPCSFCGRPRDVCPKLIAGPGVVICERCVVQATRLAAGPAVDDLRVEGSMRLEPPGSRARCSFCGNEARRVRHLVASGLAVPAGKFGHLPRICDKCRDLCLEILAETSPKLSGS